MAHRFSDYEARIVYGGHPAVFRAWFNQVDGRGGYSICAWQEGRYSEAVRQSDLDRDAFHAAMRAILWRLRADGCLPAEAVGEA